MENQNTIYNVIERVEEEIKNTASELFCDLDKEEKEQDPAELAEQLEDDITQRVFELMDNLVMYYSDAAEIVANFGYFTGWEELEMLGGELPNNISQLAYAVIYEELCERGILYGYSWAFEQVKEETEQIKNELKEN